MMKTVSIFTGAGGLDIGFENAGFRTVSALEIHPSFCETIRRNQRAGLRVPGGSGSYFQSARILQGDIRNVTASDLVPGGGEIDCLVGGPPCQAFSSAGKQRSIFDSRGSLVYEYLRILREISPRAFLFENVRGLVTARGRRQEPGEVLLELLESFGELGYSTRAGLLNSADYGSCQRRVRCFVMGSRIADAPEFPVPTHSARPVDSLFPSEKRLPWNTLRDFLAAHADDDPAGWVYPTAALAGLLEGVPDGKGLRSEGVREATRPGGHWGYRQGTFIADQTKPARTVTGSSCQDWVRTPGGILRRLTFREVAALQGFPAEWEFAGSKAERFQQVGNAVPVVFGNVLGGVFHAYLSGGYRASPRKGGAQISGEIVRAIRYTRRDNLKNGAFRVRSGTQSGGGGPARLPRCADCANVLVRNAFPAPPASPGGR